MVLLDIDVRLQSFEKSLSDIGLPVPTREDLAQIEHITNTETAIIRVAVQS